MNDSGKVVNFQEEAWKQFFSTDIHDLMADCCYEDERCNIVYTVKNPKDFMQIKTVTTISDGTISDDLKFDIEVNLKNSDSDTKFIKIEDRTLANIPLLTNSGIYMKGTQYGIRSRSGIAPGWYLEQVDKEGDAPIPAVDSAIVKRGGERTVFSMIYKSVYREEIRIEYRGSNSSKPGFYIKFNTSKNKDKDISIWTFLKALSQNEDLNSIYVRLNKLPIFRRDLLRYRMNGYISGKAVLEPSVEECAESILRKTTHAASSYTKELQDMFFETNRFNFTKNRIIRLKSMCGFGVSVGEQLAEDVIINNNGKEEILFERGTTLTAKDIATLYDNDVDKIAIEKDGVKVNLFVVSIKDKPTYNELISIIYYFGLYIMGFGSIDNKEDFKNKVISDASEIISNEIIKRLNSLTKDIVEGINNASSTEIINKISDSLKKLSRGKLVQDILIEDKTTNMRDETNSIATFEESYRITGNKNLGKDARAVNRYHQGRICSFTTPESKPVGIALSMTYGSKIIDGYVAYPVNKIVNGVVTDTKVYLTSDLEENQIIAPANVDLSENSDIPMDAMIQDCRQNGEIISAKRTDINYQDYSVLNSISPILLFVPSLNRNAGKRLTMAANAITQARQPLIRTRPWVSTGVEAAMAIGTVTAKEIVVSCLSEMGTPTNVIEDFVESIDYIRLERIKNNMGRSDSPEYLIHPDKSEKDQEIKSVNENNGDACTNTLTFSIHFKDGVDTEIMIDSVFGASLISTKTCDIHYNISSIQPTAVHNSIKHQRIKFVDDRISSAGRQLQKSCYELSDIVVVSNDTDCNDHNLSKDEINFGNEKVKTDGIKGTSLAFGNNVTVLFKSWSGYGYEDSVIVNESFARKYGLATSSLFRITYEAMNEPKDYIATSARELKEEHFEDLPHVQNGKYLRAGQVAIKKVSVNSNKDEKEHLVKVNVGQGGVVYNQFDTIKYETVKKAATEATTKTTRNVILAELNLLSAGDKVGGLHGNKGVVGRIVPEEDLPYTKYGIPDIVLNPLGVISRTNIGQLIEALLGMIGKETGTIQFLEPFSDTTIEEMIKYASDNNIEEVDVYDGRTGMKYERKAFIGNMYFLRSTHTNTSVYNACGLESINRNPASKQSIKGKGGGQRISEILANAFRAHNATTVLDTLFTIQSDDEDALRKLVSKLQEDVRRGKFDNISEDGKVITSDPVSLEVQEPTLDIEQVERDIPINYQNINSVQAYFRSLGVTVEKYTDANGKVVNGFRPINNDDIIKLVDPKYRLPISTNASIQIYNEKTSISSHDTANNRHASDNQYFAVELPKDTPVIMPMVCYNSAFLRMFMVKYIIVKETGYGKLDIQYQYKYMSMNTFKQLLYKGNTLLNANVINESTIPVVTNTRCVDLLNKIERNIRDYLYNDAGFENAKNLGTISEVLSHETREELCDKYLSELVMYFGSTDSSSDLIGIHAFAMAQESKVAGEIIEAAPTSSLVKKGDEAASGDNALELTKLLLNSLPVGKNPVRMTGIEAIMQIFTNFDTRITIAVAEKELSQKFGKFFKETPKYWDARFEDVPKFLIEKYGVKTVTGILSMFASGEVDNNKELLLADMFDIYNGIQSSMNANDFYRINHIIAYNEISGVQIASEDDAVDYKMVDDILSVNMDNTSIGNEEEMDGSATVEEDLESNVILDEDSEESMSNEIASESELEYNSELTLEAQSSDNDSSKTEFGIVNIPETKIKEFNRLCDIRTITTDFFNRDLSTNGKRDVQKFKDKYVVNWVLVPPVCYRSRFQGQMSSPIDSTLSSVYLQVSSYNNTHNSGFYKKLFEMISKSKAAAKAGKKTVLEVITSHANRNSKIRDTLFAKRVIGSGRSVIVVDPALKLGECGLPLSIASTMFEVLSVEKLKQVSLAGGIGSDFKELGNLLNNKRLADNMNVSVSYSSDKIYKDAIVQLANDNYDTFINDTLNSPTMKTKGYKYKYNVFKICQKELISFLNKLMRYFPILLNREPSLHKFNIMSFRGHVIDGYAIALHPLACRPYNADFDGDQMGCYAVFDERAIVEAKSKMDQRHNLTNPKDGKLIVELNQDMILGIYWMTMPKSNVKMYKPEVIDSVKTYVIDINNISDFNIYDGIRAEVMHELWQDIDRRAMLPQDMVTLVINRRDLGKVFTYKNTLGRILLNSVLYDGVGFTDSPVSYISNELNSKIYKLKYEDTIEKGSIKSLLVDMQDMFIRRSQNTEADITDGFDNISESEYARNSKLFCNVLDRLKDIGFYMADMSGISISVFDFSKLSISQHVNSVLQRIKGSGLSLMSGDDINMTKMNNLLTPICHKFDKVFTEPRNVQSEIISNLVDAYILLNSMSYKSGLPVKVVTDKGLVDSTLEKAYLALRLAKVDSSINVVDILSADLGSTQSSILSAILFDDYTVNENHTSEFVDETPVLSSKKSRDRFREFIDIITDLFTKNQIDLNESEFEIVDEERARSLIAESAAAQMRNRIELISQKFEAGRLTKERRVALIEKASKDFKNTITGDIKDSLEYMRNSNLYIMTNSGARGDIGSLTQVCGVIGMTGNGKGGSIETPIESNLLNGLNYNDLFKFSFNARSILVNTQLDIPQSGAANRNFSYTTEYLTIRPDSIQPSEVVPSNMEHTNMFGSDTDDKVTTVNKFDIDGVALDTDTCCDGDSVWMDIDWDASLGQDTLYMVLPDSAENKQIYASLSEEDAVKWSELVARYFLKNKNHVLTARDIEDLKDFENSGYANNVRMIDGTKATDLSTLRKGNTIIISDTEFVSDTHAESVISKFRDSRLSKVKVSNEIKASISSMEIRKGLFVNKDGSVSVKDISFKMNKLSNMSVMYRALDTEKFVAEYPELKDKVFELCFDKRAQEDHTKRIAMIISKEFLAYLNSSKTYVKSIPIYTVVNCKHPDHICRRCYGLKYDTAQIPMPNEKVGFQGVQAICSTLSQMILDTHKSSNGSEAQDSMKRINSIMQSEIDFKPRLTDDISILLRDVNNALPDNIKVVGSDNFYTNIIKGLVLTTLKSNALRYLTNNISKEHFDIFVDMIVQTLIICQKGVSIPDSRRELSKEPAEFLISSISENSNFSEISLLYMRMSVWIDLIGLLGNKDVLARNSELFPKAIIDCARALSSNEDLGIHTGSIYRVADLVDAGVPYVPIKLSSTSSIKHNGQLYAAISLSNPREGIGRAIASNSVDRGSVIGIGITGNQEEIVIKDVSIMKAVDQPKEKAKIKWESFKESELIDLQIDSFESDYDSFDFDDFDDSDFGDTNEFADVAENEVVDTSENEVADNSAFEHSSMFDDEFSNVDDSADVSEDDSAFEHSSMFDDSVSEVADNSAFEHSSMFEEEPVVAEEPVVIEEPIVAEEPVVVEEPVVAEEQTDSFNQTSMFDDTSVVEEPTSTENVFEHSSLFEESKEHSDAFDNTGLFSSESASNADMPSEEDDSVMDPEEAELKRSVDEMRALQRAMFEKVRNNRRNNNII